MSVMEIKWGLIPDMGITATMPGVLSEDRAKELAFTGRVVKADEAIALNLVTELAADPLAKATAVAKEIAGKSPDAIRSIKKMIGEAWRGNPADMLALEAKLQMAVMAGDNQQEAAAANLEKRSPEFRDPP
jgi:enoyl-CoA hydratase/carnithine racemase